MSNVGHSLDAPAEYCFIKWYTLCSQKSLGQLTSDYMHGRHQRRPHVVATPTLVFRYTASLTLESLGSRIQLLQVTQQSSTVQSQKFAVSGSVTRAVTYQTESLAGMQRVINRTN